MMPKLLNPTAKSRPKRAALSILTACALLTVAVSAQNATPAQPPAQTPPNAQPQTEPPTEAGGAGERIITITYDGGTRSSPDLRYGPYVYEHPQQGGVAATVSNLEIFAQRGELRAPAEVLIAEAEGRREASFSGGVRVERGRLTATGAALDYGEATGRGVMPQKTAIVVQPAKDGNNVTNITTDQVSFNVDTDTSVSRGNVVLTSGSQSAEAEELTFEEERDLAVLTDETSQAVARRQSEDGTTLTITADEIRVLTGTDVLLATGNVSIIDSDITTTGDTVYYDDETSRAEVIGNPAVSVDEAFGFTTRAGRIEQRTDTDVVRQLSDPTPSFDAGQFRLTGEEEGG